MNNELNQIINSLEEFIEKINILIYYYRCANKYKSKIIHLLNLHNKTASLKRNFFNLLHQNSSELEKAKEIINEVIIDLKKNVDLNIQYKTFLKKEIVNTNWQGFSFLNNYYLNIVQGFEQKLDTKEIENIHFEQNEFQVLDLFQFVIDQSVTNQKDLMVKKISSIKIFNRIKDINNNIVIIGPNGSGKSTFARTLNNFIDDNIAIISAQHLLIYDPPRDIPIESDTMGRVRNYQRSSKLGNEGNLAESLKTDFSNLVMALFEEKADNEHEYYKKDNSKPVSLLDTAIDIWDYLITHRELVHTSRYNIEVITKDGNQKIYSFNNLSDGEKSVFYYIGHVLLAEGNSYILIDEPENHLHLSVCIKLWDLLEEKRKDCTFIYITHNIDFAVSRNNNTLIWNKNFTPPYDWDFEEIESDEEIPDILLMEIMGSRKNVLFCEGDDRNSLDFKIYSKIFSNYNVIPVNGHENVINYCKSFNKNIHLSGFECFGIIDGDAHSEEQIHALLESNVMVLPYNEIENLICTEEVLKRVIDATGSQEESLNKFKDEFFLMVNADKEKVAVWYANNRINNYLKHNMFKQTKDLDKLREEVKEIIDSDKIQSYFNERLSKIEEDCKYKNYSSIIKYINFKKRLSRGLANKHIVNNYEDRLMNFISRNSDFRVFIIDLVRQYFSLLKIEETY